MCKTVPLSLILGIEGSEKMYRLLDVQDTVRVPPSRFSEDRAKVIVELLRQKYEGILDHDYGVILSISDV